MITDLTKCYISVSIKNTNIILKKEQNKNNKINKINKLNNFRFSFFIALFLIDILNLNKNNIKIKNFKNKIKLIINN